MADSVRQKCYDEILSRLRSISTAAGYNSDPGVYDSQKAAHTAQDAISLWVTFGDELFDLPQRTLGGGQPATLTLQVHGYCRRQADRDGLVALQEQAIQDVRNAAQASLENWRANTAATLQGFDTCETDEGVLSFDGMAFFTQPLILSYVAGPTW